MNEQNRSIQKFKKQYLISIDKSSKIFCTTEKNFFEYVKNFKNDKLISTEPMSKNLALLPALK